MAEAVPVVDPPLVVETVTVVDPSVTDNDDEAISIEDVGEEVRSAAPAGPAGAEGIKHMLAATPIGRHRHTAGLVLELMLQVLLSAVRGPKQSTLASHEPQVPREMVPVGSCPESAPLTSTPLILLQR